MKMIKNKQILRMITVCMVCVLAVLLLGSGRAPYVYGKDEEYRNIKIYDISGTAKVEREIIGELDAYTGMMLQSEDVITTEKDSYLYLKMDEDKYALLEPESKIRLVASGNSRDSKTSIYLEEGAIVNRLDKDLSKDSIYEVNAPNSTMAVRGTNFRIEVIRNENGESRTYVYVFEGTVACHLIFPDGSVDEREVLAEGGSGIEIFGDVKDSVYVVIGEKVDYESLSLETLKFLAAVAEKGVPLSITEEDLKELIEQKTVKASPVNKTKEEEKKEETTTEPVKDPQESAKDDTKEDTKEDMECAASPNGKHSWKDAGMDPEPGCETEGTQWYRCEYCEEQKSETVPATGHTEVTDEAVEATCTEVGKTEGSYCTVCETVFKAQEEIPAIGHDWSAHDGVCSREGCGQLCSHEGSTVTDEAVEATCTEAGKTEGSHCTVCGTVLKAQEEVLAMGHDWSAHDGVCGREGCGLVCSHEGSTVVDEAVAETCTEAGKTQGSHCEVCGVVLTEQKEIPAKGHSWKNSVCENCGTACTHEGTTITYSSSSATCTKPGWTSGSYCTACKTTLREQYDIPAKGHSWSGGICERCQTECAHTSVDKETRTCSVCGMFVSLNDDGTTNDGNTDDGTNTRPPEENPDSATARNRVD